VIRLGGGGGEDGCGEGDITDLRAGMKSLTAQNSWPSLQSVTWLICIVGFSYRYASKAKNTNWKSGNSPNYIRVKSPTCNDSITNNGLK